MVNVLVNSQGKVLTSDGKAITGAAAQINNQNKTFTANGTYTADEGYTGLGNVTVNVSSGETNKRKFGLSIDQFVGDLNSSGIYSRPTEQVDVSFDGLTGFYKEYDKIYPVMKYMFSNMKTIKTVTFPDLVSIGSNTRGVLAGMCYQCESITGAYFPALTTIQISSMFEEAFYGCTALTTIDFSKLVTVDSSCFKQAFYGCTALTSADFSSLTTFETNSYIVFQEAFSGCTALTSADFSSLTTISYAIFNKTFKDCTSLTQVKFDNLTTISVASLFSETFSGCTALQTFTFPSLSSITYGTIFSKTFSGCTSLQTLYFPALTSESFGSVTNQFNQMLTGCSDVTVHFPSNLQSVIGSWTDVTNGFGGTNTTVLFDLTATS